MFDMVLLRAADLQQVLFEIQMAAASTSTAALGASPKKVHLFQQLHAAAASIAEEQQQAWEVSTGLSITIDGLHPWQVGTKADIPAPQSVPCRRR
jgi:hypothetical protein